MPGSVQDDDVEANLDQGVLTYGFLLPPGFDIARYTRFTPNLAIQVIIKQHRPDKATP